MPGNYRHIQLKKLTSLEKNECFLQLPDFEKVFANHQI